MLFSNKIETGLKQKLFFNGYISQIQTEKVNETIAGSIKWDVINGKNVKNLFR